MKSVVVIGAGLSGLHCARTLRNQGFDVVVLEKSDRVGGRVKTDVVDGFQLDHGFQVINPAYSELREIVKENDFDFQLLLPGFEIVINGKNLLVGDFRRDIRYLLGDLSSDTGTFWEKFEFLRYIATKPEDQDFAQAMVKSGFFYRNVIKGFLDGVFLADSDEISSLVAHELLRWFVKGSPGLPSLGVEALPRALANNLDVRLNCEVTKIQGTEIDTTHGNFNADYVVLACDPKSTSHFLKSGEVKGNSCTTWYHSVSVGAITSKHLRVMTKSKLLNSVAISNVAPSYAPRGLTLISSTSLVSIPEIEIRKEVAHAWGLSVNDLSFIRLYEIKNAVPFHAPQKPLQMSQKITERLIVAGDYYSFPSQQGALLSGRKAAELIIADQ